MRKRSATKLAGALLCGGLAGYLALGSLRAREGPDAASAVGGLQAVVAARDLPGGAVLSAEDVRLIPWPGDELPAGFARSPEQVIGHGLLAPLHSDEPLLTSKLAGQGSGQGLPILIPPGMRALSVRVDDVIAVAGFVVPGTRVDILVTVDPGQARGVVSRVVLQNVTVLASGQSFQSGEGEPRDATVITLLVTPREAEVLTLAAAEGRIQLALRNGLDTERMMTPGAWIQALAGEAAPGPPRPAPAVRAASRRAPGSAIEIYNGSARTVVTFGGS